MKLVALKLNNFRAYRSPVELPVGDFTAVIGRNDVGKSTLLEALEVFFNHVTIKLDQSDPCVHTASKLIEISCVFEDLPASLTLDENSQTTLEAEYLLNQDGRLEIVKRFDCTAAKPKEEVCARAWTSNHEKLRDLLKLKNTDLKARAKELACDEGVDKRSNAALRAAIRGHIGKVDMQELLVPLNEQDGKKAWEQIDRAMPTFALFQADRPSKDDDPEVTDPMKLAVASAVKDVQAELDEIKEKVHERVMEVAARTLEKLKLIDPKLAQELTPSFKAEPNWNGFKLSLTSDDQIPINKRGSGVRRLILLSFFRAEAERRRLVSDAKRVIYAIEEPESSQHPDSQALLLKSLLELGDDPKTQVLITTHVPGVAALIPEDSVRLVTHQANLSPLIEVGGDDVYRKVADALGVMPDKRAQVAIYVEGPNDVEFLTAASRLHRTADATLIDLDTDHRIAFVPTGGGNLQQWVNRQYLRNAGLVEVHIYDTDVQGAPKYADQVNAVNARGNRDIAFNTGKREMENYIPGDAIHAALGVNLAFTDWCDVPELVAEQLHILNGGQGAWAALDEGKKKLKVGKTKRKLNSDVMAVTTLAQLAALDAQGEIATWLGAVKERVV